MVTRRRTFGRLLAGLLLSCTSAQAAVAQTLTIGLAGAVTPIDPHYYNATPNNRIAQHIFDPLIRRTANGRLVPGIATEWRAVDEARWEIRLRDGVTWHDGTPSTAEDVAFALTRLRNVPGAPGGFASLINTVSGVEVTRPFSLRNGIPGLLLAARMSPTRSAAAATARWMPASSIAPAGPPT